MRIVCLSVVPFYGFPERPQQLMKRLVNHRVLYFDPPPYTAAKNDVEHRWKDESLQEDKRIEVFATPPIPLWMRGNSLTRKIAHRRFASYVNQRVADFTVEDAVLWMYSPEYTDCLDMISHKAVVFDCHPKLLADEASGVYKETLKLAEKSDLVLASTRAAFERLAKVNGNVILIPNGADFALFNKVADDEYDPPFPDDLFNVQNPIFGLTGKIDETIDLTFIEAGAKAHPEWAFAIMGDISPRADMSPVESLKNVHLLGKKPQNMMPRYLKRFDVCLNLHKNTGQEDGESQSNFYEYMATGKPIVSTPHPVDVLDYAEVINLAGTHDEFVSACRKALTENNNWKVKQRIAHGQTASWNARVAAVEKVFKEKGLLD